MMRLALLAVLALSACGIDGPPVRPGPATSPQQGVTVSGEARIGVVADDL